MGISFRIKLIFIVLYYILIISTEIIYNEKLFNKSLTIIPEFQKTSKNFDIFWKSMTFLGTKPAIGFIYILLFLFIPLNKVYALTFLLLFTGFVDHTLKIVYMQERPLWMNDDIDIGSQHACGYGNPSGHSLSSTCLYLSLWYIISQIIDDKVINKSIARTLKYIILLLCILIFIIIMISRLYLGVHSLNQIIFGSLFGFGIFLLFLPILKIYHNSGDEFFKKHYLNRYKHLIFILLLIAFFYIFYFYRNDIPGIEEKVNWQKMCYDQKWSKLLIKGSFMGGMSIFIILGMIIGLLITKNKIDKEYNLKENIIINWEKGNFISRIIRLLFLIIGFSPVGIIFLINYFFNISYIFYYIFTPIIFFIGGFLSFGPCLFYGFKFILNKFGNEELYPINRENNKSMSKLVDFSNEIFN